MLVAMPSRIPHPPSVLHLQSQLPSRLLSIDPAREAVGGCGLSLPLPARAAPLIVGGRVGYQYHVGMRGEQAGDESVAGGRDDA